MKKRVAILGSTGSIGKSLLKIIEKDQNNFEIVLLTANKDYKTLLNQAKKFRVKNLIITNTKSYEILKKKKFKKKVKIFSSFKYLNKIFRNKIDYIMSSIVGIDGLVPTIKSIKHTKTIAIANKESIICGWNLIKNELKKNKTRFIPVDSEHYSLWFGLKDTKIENLEKIYITASGGPFLNTSLSKLNKATVKEATKHPNWKMGKKISVDSATMINKVYEIIEAKNIFNIPYNKIEVLIHPNSYIHSIIKYNNGLIKYIAHDTTMKIPIFNTLYSNNNKKIITKKLTVRDLNNLSFENLNIKKYPMIKVLKYLQTKLSLYETIIISANDTLVGLFLKKYISFFDIQKILFQTIKTKEFLKFKKIYPTKISDITNLNKYVRLKILKKVYKTKNV